ncbi:MAG: hypothetical protein KDB22_17365 [Planctomycetales bacterium]|nr:hypothetical protein [Planctomycetales bacterium]
MQESPIDWPAVLGPILSSTEDPLDIQDLDRAVRCLPPRAVRRKPKLDVTSLPFPVTDVPWFEGGHFVPQDCRPGGFLNYLAGDYYVQDAGSMLPVALSNIGPGQLICDTCAAPGGKTTAILEQLDGTGLLLANEVISSRMPALKQAIWRTGYGNCLTTSLDVEILAQRFPAQFDCVIVDAPCSGQSMLARGKQSLAAFSDMQSRHSSARQQRIIRAAAQLVKPLGKLVYSTCTFSYIENEAIVEQFLAEHADWHAPPLDPRLQPWVSPIQHGSYRLWPHRDNCAGGFAAIVQRQFSAEGSHVASHGFSQSPKHGRTKLNWQMMESPPEEVAAWFSLQSIERVRAQFRWIQVKDSILLVPALADRWANSADGVCVVAQRKANRWQPLYASSVLDKRLLVPKFSITLSDEQALAYVQGLSIGALTSEQVQEQSLESSRDGWCAVLWSGRALSWGKWVSGVLKNHFPKPLRQTNMQASPRGA